MPDRLAEIRARLDAPVPSHNEWPGVALEAALTVQREDIAWLLDRVRLLEEKIAWYHADSVWDGVAEVWGRGA